MLAGLYYGISKPKNCGQVPISLIGMWEGPNSQLPIIPFIRIWPRREIFLPTTLESILPGGNFLLQLFYPFKRRCTRWECAGFLTESRRVARPESAQMALLRVFGLQRQSKLRI